MFKDIFYFTIVSFCMYREFRIACTILKNKNEKDDYNEEEA